ncbi:LLM class flavin-dependent oxidoreductase [Peribacillus simplex]|uniref:Limonene 1,2-monooxygenase n=2 Tax=Peribacillus simplex TaxID=1478 RepID=A0A223EB98_9BACI|nr:LLM class flavin-dependent oxidoreductase [Peribacillus simplex]ASS92539.1 limonene 1,2-monooxygenase [Peribacillus simplex NBRC 15720 = DSM 1321]MEC1400787.1 LLM class flavin-dependent oxidoreductase [Peribacillus simplex]MED3912848.1 LLM class flavin-dependent oxidoreductase [Peribacillus simplex]TVX75709.1 LLM class flavin-dependent oxidoreductase [Peribacillus simplex]
MISLNILDYSPIDEGSNAREALFQTTELAKKADKLGYSRFWVSEHHQMLSLAGSNPEMLMMHLAASTERIRIGSGGVMLPHYSSYKVAENFRMLEALYPNRIDLGLGRAPGANSLVTYALNEEKSRPLPYEQQVVDLKSFLTDEFSEDHRFNELTATPVIDTKPEMWILGAGGGSARIAAENGTAFTFAHFINPFGDGLTAVKHYRENFKPSSLFEEPKVMIGVFAVVAETNEEAEEIAKAFDLWLLKAESLQTPTSYPSIQTAMDYQYSPHEIERISRNRNRVLVGDAKKVKNQIEKLAQLYGTNEITILPNISGAHNRIKSIELLAEAYNLSNQ